MTAAEILERLAEGEEGRHERARDHQIQVLAMAFPSDVLRAASDVALVKELGESVTGNLPCDDCISQPLKGPLSEEI